MCLEFWETNLCPDSNSIRRLNVVSLAAGLLIGQDAHHLMAEGMRNDARVVFVCFLSFGITTSARKELWVYVFKSAWIWDLVDRVKLVGMKETIVKEL